MMRKEIIDLESAHAARPFVHLHLHSHYSVLDGICKIDPLLARAKELGFSALALTDHGVMHGAIEFYTKAKNAGIKPILGLEVRIAPGSRYDRPAGGSREGEHHLILLAKNHIGYQNLSRLSTVGCLEGCQDCPQIDKDVLRKHSDGIIALSGCLSGEVSRHDMEACLACASAE